MSLLIFAMGMGPRDFGLHCVWLGIKKGASGVPINMDGGTRNKALLTYSGEDKNTLEDFLSR